VDRTRSRYLSGDLLLSLPHRQFVWAIPKVLRCYLGHGRSLVADIGRLIEVDFLVSQNRKPMFLVETKTGDDTTSPNLVRFQKALSVPAAAPSLTRCIAIHAKEGAWERALQAAQRSFQKLLAAIP
jgi:hypothetical protein